MSYMHMPYPGHQLLPQLRTFLLDTYMRYGRLRNWEPRRLLGHVYHRHPAEAGTTLAHLQADWHIWYDANQQIVGAVLCEDAAHQYIQTHPDHHVLVAEMVAWVTSQGAAHPPSIWCHDDDVHLQQLLVARGYQQEPAHMLQKYCDLRQQHFVPSPLPTGYRIGTMDRTARRGAQMAALLNQAFGRTTHSAAEYANFQQLMPDYRETSDWIVLSPTDDVVCSVGMTWYPEAQLVIIEPVATHPAHQGRGLARTGIRPCDGGDYGRILFAPTMGGITGGMVFAPTTEYMLPTRMSGDMVLKILPPTLQNVLKIPLEGAFLAQGRINAPPNQQQAA